MKVVRIQWSGGVDAGALEGGEVSLFDRSRGSCRRTGRVVRLADAKLLAPVEPSKILGVGKNYLEHLREMGHEPPERPALFMKPPTSVIGPDEAVVLPPAHLGTQVEHEAELAVVIGRVARRVPVDAALDHVLGFTCANDVSARDLQRADGGATRAKGFDTFCPTGPWIETALDINDGVRVRCTVNGQLRQEGHTSQMLFAVPFLVSYLSQFTTLLPGDLVLTGSPGGSGKLVAGDLVEIAIEGIGTLRHGVAESPSGS